MIKVRAPSVDVIHGSENSVHRFPEHEIVGKYNAALEEIKRLQAVNPQGARQLVKHIMVDKIVDNPELVAKIKNLEDQVSHLDTARLSYQTKWMQSQSRPGKVEIKVEEKIIDRLVPYLDWKITTLFSLGSLLSGVLIGKIFF